jgi:hypothetical protein
MSDRLLLIILKNRLKRYKRDERFYKKIADDSNYYTSVGIPDLKKQIKELENKINNKDNCANRKCTNDKCQVNCDGYCCYVGINPKKCSSRNTKQCIGF